MLKGLQRTKALSELNKIVQSKASLKGLAKTLALKKQNELRLDLGMGKNTPAQTTQEYADTLLFNKSGQILLAQRSAEDDFKPNKWWIVGGKIETDETPEQGAIRELEEETGVKLSDLKFVEKTTLSSGGISHRFAGVVKDNTPIHLKKDELQAYAWVDTDKLGEYELLGTLGDLQDLVELGSEIAGFDGDVERDDETVVIDGKEFKNHNLDFEQESNKQLLRDEVRKYLENLAGDNGKHIFNHFLGRDVLLNGRGIREMLAWSHQVIKLQILHGIEQIIKQARGVGDYKQINGKKDKKAHAEYYYHLETPIQLASMKLTVKVIIEEDVNGLLQYDVRVPRTALGKNKALYDALTHDTHSWNTSNNAYVHHNNKFNRENQDNFMLDRLNNDIGLGDMLLNLFVFDENGNEVGDEVLGDGWDGNDKTADIPQTAYQLADKATPTRRQKDNNTAVALMRELQASGRKATADEKAILSHYTGTGGNLVGDDGLQGSDYEYYTPIEVASSMWDLAKELGFDGGAVLDPSAGTGIFKAAAPTGTLMHSVELSEISGKINALINDDDTHKVTVSPFEKVASTTADESFDFVITNVPFGTNAARGANKQYDKLYQKDSLEEYFIKRSLDKLKPNKLAMFIVPTKILDGSNYRKFRHSISLRAELVGAYRLPNKVFDKTGADVTTDIIVLKKFDSEIKAKIDSLNDNGGQKVLEQAKVLDKDIISGKYFKTYGKKFVLGEYQIGKGRYGDVVRVVNDDSLANILKLVRKFGDSRIDYDLLEVEPIVEKSLENGDVRVLDGQTYEYQNGVWNAKESESYDEYPFASIDNFIHKKPSKNDVQAYFAYLMSVGKKPSDWLTLLQNTAKNDDELYYYAVLTGVGQALAKTHHTAYANLYPELTKEMGNIANSYHTKKYKAKAYQGLTKAVAVAFDSTGRKGVSDYWYTGAGVVLDDMTLDNKQAYEKAVYNGLAENWQVDVETIRQSNPDFDPLADDEFCINADGTKVIAKKDYYVGNYGEFLAKIDDEIANAKDPKIKEKLLKQKAYADSLIDYTNVSKMSFGLTSRIIPTEIKYRFFNEFVDGATILVPHKTDDRDELDLDAKDITSFDKIDDDPNDNVAMRRYLLNRVFIHINNNEKLTVAKAQFKDDNEAFTELNQKLTKYYNELNINFNAWLRTQKDYMAQLEHDFNAPENKAFKTVSDGTPFEIANFKPKYDNFKSLHDYQFEEVRRLSRSFSGICGFGVGLGKTSTALATIQNMHNIGVKKRTFIIVPNHTISKWAKDIANMYDDTSDVLVIGTDENQNDSTSSKHYASDFALLTQTKGKAYRKILMTVEAFGKIPMKKDHIIQYFDKDTGNKRSNREKLDGQLAEVVAKLNTDEQKLPYFEDMAVDSLVMDEAQLFKNGLDGGGEFNRIRGLSSTSLDKLAARALSSRVKSWWVRGQNKAKTGLDDGVVLLTATPFTNSPIEILTMLSLAVGDEKAKKMFGGTAINSVDDFLSVFANIESILQKDITNENVTLDMFTGFQNVELLKSVIHQVANIQTAKDRGLKIPDEEHITSNTELADADKAMLAKMKQFYRVAKLVEKGDMLGISPELFAEYKAYREQVKEPDSTIGHAFSLISRMSELTLVGSDMALNRNVIINFDESQSKLAQKVADEFNKAKKSKNEFKTTRNYPLDDEFVSVKTKKDDDGNEKNEYTVKARASVEGNRLILNVDDATMLANLMELVEKNSLNIKPKLSAKAQALIENVKLEMATPKHEGYAKQLIFCDVLSMHQIIKHALIGECGIPQSQIAILNAQTLPNGKAGSPDTEDVQQIQDLFADNTYTIVIANKKAETGIDLQKGTQAIHHLTTGWTPDSLDQRNGRGVRQGNTQEKVTIYAYNANGTFDEYKKNLIAGKASWIDSLMQKDTEVKGVLTVASQLSEQDYEDLIDADNAESIAKIIKDKAEREKAEREKRVQANNTFIYNNMDKARQQAQHTDYVTVFMEQLVQDLNAMIPLVRNNAGGDKAKQKRLEKAKLLMNGYDGLPNDDKLWGMVVKSAEKRANAYGSTISQYDVERLFADEHAIRAELNITGWSLTPEQERQIKERKQQLIANAFDVENKASKRIKNIISSRLEMLETTKQAFLNNDESEYSRDERQAIVDGTAGVYQDKLVYHNDIVRYESHNNQIAYAVAQVYSDGSVNFRTNDYQGYDKLTKFDKVKESERQTAIEFFVAFDYRQARENDLKKTDYRFSKLLDEVRKQLFAKIDDEKGNFENEWVEATQYRLVHKASGRAYGEYDVWQAFADDGVLAKVKQAYYEPMAGLLEKTAEQQNNNYINIKRKDMALFDDKNSVFSYDFYSKHLRPFLLSNGLKINLASDTDKTTKKQLSEQSFGFHWDIEKFLGITKRPFTPIKEYDEYIKKLAYAKYGDMIGNIDELLEVGLSSVFVDNEIGAIQSTLGERSDIDPDIAKNDTLHKQAVALSVPNKQGVQVIGLRDSGWTLKNHKEQLKQIIGQDEKGKNLYEWHREQSVWVVPVSMLDKLTSQSWWDFDRIEVQTPQKYA